MNDLQRPFRSPLTVAIDSCTRDASIALAFRNQIIRYIPLDRQSRTAATISIALQELLDHAASLEQNIELVAVTDGPGSFTGLRIGVTTAKTLAYALNCQLVAVDSLACMASKLFARAPEATKVTVALNAYRGQLFTATWTREQWTNACDRTGDFTTQSRVIESEQWIEIMQTEGDDHLLGAESVVAKQFDSDRVATIEPNACDVAWMSEVIAMRKRFVSPMELMPRYLRESAAEEKLRVT